jgi:hypothetical protein
MWKKLTLQDDKALDLATDACLAILSSLLITVLIHAVVNAL